MGGGSGGGRLDENKYVVVKVMWALVVVGMELDFIHLLRFILSLLNFFITTVENFSFEVIYILFNVYILIFFF